MQVFDSVAKRVRDTPHPATPEARAAGCRCTPVREAIYGPTGVTFYGWAYSAAIRHDCPLHGEGTAYDRADPYGDLDCE